MPPALQCGVYWKSSRFSDLERELPEQYEACSRYDPVVRTENRGAQPAISLPSMPFTMSHKKPFLIYAARRSSNTRELFHFEFARNR
jgi:hypothetical protein